MTDRLYFVLALGVSACANDTEDPPLTVDPAVAALRDMQVEACERQVACGYPLLGPEGDVDACITIQERATGDVLPSLGDGAVILRADRLAACTAALAAASCEDIANLRFDVHPACTTYWEGTVAEGEACRGGAVNDCQAGLACDFGAGVCPGTCVAPPADCVEGTCAEGEFCDALARCMPQAALGAACGSVVEGALHESACVPDARCADGVCVARIAADAPCSGQYELECTADHACACDDTACTTRSCQPAPTAGEACQTGSDCAGDLFCDFAVGTCAERKAAGAACNDSYGMCQPGLVCDDGTCKAKGSGAPVSQPLLEAGDPCGDGGVCPLGTVCRCETTDCPNDDKACLPGAALGASCADFLSADYSPFVCAEGLCDLFGSLTCVQPAAPGEPCEGTQTFGCGSFICLDGRCATLEQTRCE